MLVTIFLAAFIVRICFNIWWVGVGDIPANDAADYNNIGITLLKTGKYTMLGRSPLFPTFIAVAYWLFGENPFVVRVFLSIIGSVTSCFIFFIGRAAFNSRVGWYAAYGSTAYAMLFYWNGYLLTETLFTFWLCFFVLCLLKAAQKPLMMNFVFGGIFLGLATLTRPTTLLFLPFCFLWAFITFKGKYKRFIISGLSIFALAVSVLLPWTYRNYLVTGHLIPVTTMGGKVLLGSNNPNVMSIFKGGWVPPEKTGLIINGEDEGLSAVGKDKLYTRKAISFIKENPLLVVKLMVYKFKLFWHINRAVNPSLLQYFLVIILAVVGAVKAWRLKNQIFILYLIPVFFTFIGLIFWGDDRLRSPIEPILLVFASFGAECLLLKYRLIRKVVTI